MGERIQLTAIDSHTLDAYVVHPAPRDFSAVVVIQEIFGVNRHIRSVVDDYAKQGFLAIAPALFDRAKRGVELNYTKLDSAQGMELATQIGIDNSLYDVTAAIAYGAKHATSKKVGVVGFCYGGVLAWLSATRLSVNAAVCYYGGRISNYAAEQPHCPVMLHFGAQDKHIPLSEIDKIRHAHPRLSLFLYENAGHGFNCDQRADYDPAAASLARERTLQFLRSHLQAQESSSSQA